MDARFGPLARCGVDPETSRRFCDDSAIGGDGRSV
jgi:hypothetical protein